MAERLRELRELQDGITAAKRDDLVGSRVEVLVDEPGVGRTHREAPEIDGVVLVPDGCAAGSIVELTVTAALGPDLEAA
jgi:tRNA A37 methylthiotransferase MiaB